MLAGGVHTRHERARVGDGAGLRLDGQRPQRRAVAGPPAGRGDQADQPDQTQPPALRRRHHEHRDGNPQGAVVEEQHAQGAVRPLQVLRSDRRP